MTTPEKTTPLPWRAVSDDQGSFAILGASEGDGIAAFSVYAPDDRLIVTAVNSLHAIAPGREIELAEALPSLIASLRLIAECKDKTLLGGSIGELLEIAPNRDPDSQAAHELGAYKAFNQCADIALACLNKLGLNEGKND